MIGGELPSQGRVGFKRRILEVTRGKAEWAKTKEGAKLPIVFLTRWVTDCANEEDGLEERRGEAVGARLHTREQKERHQAKYPGASPPA